MKQTLFIIFIFAKNYAAGDALPLFPFVLLGVCRESVELVLFIFTLMPPPPALVVGGIEFAGDAGILGDPGRDDDL